MSIYSTAREVHEKNLAAAAWFTGLSDLAYRKREYVLSREYGEYADQYTRGARATAVLAEFPVSRVAESDQHTWDDVDGYRWLPVNTTDGQFRFDEPATGELHYFTPDGRNLSLGLCGAIDL